MGAGCVVVAVVVAIGLVGVCCGGVEVGAGSGAGSGVVLVAMGTVEVGLGADSVVDATAATIGGVVVCASAVAAFEVTSDITVCIIEVFCLFRFFSFFAAKVKVAGSKRAMPTNKAVILNNRGV